jgi:hypothetical protein
MDSRDLSGDRLRPSRQTVEDKPINNVLFIPRASNRFTEVVGHKRAPIFGHHRFKFWGKPQLSIRCLTAA